MTLGQHPSLRVNLMRLIALPIILAGLVIGGFALAFTYQEIGEVYDAQLAQAGKLLLQLTEHQLEQDEKRGIRIDTEEPDFSHLYEKKISFRIWLKGKLVTQSPSASFFGPKPAPAGFSNRGEGADSWRFFAISDEDNDLLVEVAENNDIRAELILQIMSSLFLPAVIFIPMILGFVWFGTTRSLKPVAALSHQVNMRGAQDLTPLPTAAIAGEILPFVSALNRMLVRVDQSLQREREFTDNAAHELRTPLAIMKTQTQVLLKKASDMPECKEDLRNLLASIDRAAHMVSQLLTFARLQNTQDAMSEVDLSALVADSLREMFPLIEAKKQGLEADIEPSVRITGSANALRILARNLIDNAHKYTPEEGHITVSLARRDEKIILTVCDDGPGIPAALHEKIFDRFYRINKGAGTGSGLGLGMVKWIADVHHAGITVKNIAPHGVAISIAFPA